MNEMPVNVDGMDNGNENPNGEGVLLPPDSPGTDRVETGCVPPNVALRAAARQILSGEERRVSLIVALLILLTLWIGGLFVIVYPVSVLMALVVPEGASVAFWLVNVLPFGLFALFGFFLLAPVGCGLMRYLLSLTEPGTGRRTLSDLFLPFSSGWLYCRTLAYLWGDVWRGALALALPVLIWQNALGSGEWLWVVLAVPLSAGCLVAVLALLSPTALTPVLIWERPELSVRKCRRLSRQLTKGARSSIFRQHLWCIVMSALSLLTLGIVLILHALPLWLVSYVTAARALTLPEPQMNVTSEDLKYEEP